ncbi:MAG TPA: helix-turn-helix domain-containing protein [Candidatus Limnocylindria bacterium]|nr:helix-turn-helix domain-containing protein [Candidatus Limnocylindria bacterium]
MSSVLDLWRVIDPEARLLAGSADALRTSARGIARTRIAPPHLPPPGEAQLLLVDGAILRDAPLDELLDAIAAAGLGPAAIVLCGDVPPERPLSDTPILLSRRAAPQLADAAREYLADESVWLQRYAAELRLAAAEVALADPTPSAPASLVAARLRRGVAVSADGELRAVHPRSAGRAIGARFSATFARVLASAESPGAPVRRALNGLFLLEHPVRRDASVWLFDDLPFARIDEVAAEALGITLRALLRRPPEDRVSRRRTEPIRKPQRAPQRPLAAGASDRITETLLAVARANGRVAPAARTLGVHRNTVLYRLKVARAERGIDPRRPEDALRLLAEHRRQTE